MYDGDHMTTGGWIFGGVTMVLLIALVVVAIVWLVRSSEAGGARSRRDAGGGSARHTLDVRLASGEIDEDTYRRLRALLADPNTSPPAG
jgi:uncharacterized membrane protein